MASATPCTCNDRLWRPRERLPSLLIIPRLNLSSTTRDAALLKKNMEKNAFNEDNNEDEPEMSAVIVHTCSFSGLITSALRGRCSQFSAFAERNRERDATRGSSLNKPRVDSLAVRRCRRSSTYETRL